VADPARHGWSRYVDDLPLLLNEIGVDRAVVAGAGMGSTIALLAGLRLPDPLHAIGAAGVEAIEIDENSEARKAVATVFPRMATQIEHHPQQSRNSRRLCARPRRRSSSSSNTPSQPGCLPSTIELRR
jgi:pimeloyl-ACP methyl ester carboxylesterase